MKLRSLLLGAGIGGLLVYYYDPTRGEARRLRLREQLDTVGRRGEAALEELGQQMGLQPRQSGMPVAPEGPLSDEALAERVRAELGRACSHPKALIVSAREGIVTIAGPILAREVDNLLHTVEDVRGVMHVENRLNVYDQPGDIPALQD